MGYGKGNPGRPKGTSKYPYRDDQEREQIVALIKRGTDNAEISALTGWSPLEVRDLRQTYFPTVGLAQDYLRANALALARRIVEESNVEEAVDILSRPNIGVLEPALKQQPGPRIGIVTNINTQSLGGVMAPTIETQIVDLEGTPPCLPPSASAPAPALSPRLSLTSPSRGPKGSPKTRSRPPAKPSTKPPTRPH